MSANTQQRQRQRQRGGAEAADRQLTAGLSCSPITVAAHPPHCCSPSSLLLASFSLLLTLPAALPPLSLCSRLQPSPAARVQQQGEAEEAARPGTGQRAWLRPDMTRAEAQRERERERERERRCTRNAVDSGWAYSETGHICSGPLSLLLRLRLLRLLLLPPLLRALASLPHLALPPPSLLLAEPSGSHVDSGQSSEGGQSVAAFCRHGCLEQLYMSTACRD